MKLIKWHKEFGNRLMGRVGIDWYSIAWISWLKGLITGFVIYHFLLV